MKVVPGEKLREIKSGIKRVTARLHTLLQGKDGAAGLQKSEKYATQKTHLRCLWHSAHMGDQSVPVSCLSK